MRKSVNTLKSVALAAVILASSFGYAQQAGTGTLAIAGAEYSLNVLYCSQLGEPGTIALNAKASNADGSPILNLNLTSSDMNGRKEQYVDIAFADGEHYEARVANTGAGWQPAGPIVAVTLPKVSVKGTFYDPEGNAFPGSIEITCPG